MLIVGIDEAGKGPIIGSMFIGFCVFSSANIKLENFDKYISKIEVKDSKKLTQKKRKKILEEVFFLDKIYFEKTKISSFEIDKSKNMYELEIDKICEKLNEIKPNLIIIDSLSSRPDNFEKKITQKLTFETKIICENKADDKYKIVSLASIFAKEKREEEIFSLKKKFGFDFGSGYTSDKKTIGFLKDNISNEKVLEYVRKSFKTYSNLKQKDLFNF